MQCPYCKKDMIKGHIQTRGEVIKWLPENKNSQFLATRWEVRKNEVKLGKYSYFTGGDVEAYRCEECKKIIINYSLEDNDKE